MTDPTRHRSEWDRRYRNDYCTPDEADAAYAAALENLADLSRVFGLSASDTEEQP